MIKKSLIGYLLLLFIFISCYVKENDRPNNSSVNELKHDERNENISFDSNLENKKEPDSEKYLIGEFLKLNKIIPSTYNSDLIFFITKKILGQDISALVVKYENDSLSSLGVDRGPIINVLVLQSTSHVLWSKIIDSVDKNDFNFAFEHDNNYFFEYYSSPVGYIELYIINLNDNKVYLTERIMDGETFDTLSIDYDNLKFSVQDNLEIKRMTKTLKSVKGLKL